MKRKGLPSKGSPLVVPKKILLHTAFRLGVLGACRLWRRWRRCGHQWKRVVEEGSGADEGWLRLECDALLGLRLLQILAAGEMTVDQRSIGQRPRVQEMFGGLQFGGEGRGRRTGGSAERRGWAHAGADWCAIRHDPARSSASTIFFLGLTPTWCAKAASSASSASKSGMLTEVAR